MQLTEITEDWTSGLGGVKFSQFIIAFLQENEQIEISFFEIDLLTPSFMDAAFLWLIDQIGIERFRNGVKIVQINKNVAVSLRKYINEYLLHKNSTLFLQNKCGIKEF